MGKKGGGFWKLLRWAARKSADRVIEFNALDFHKDWVERIRIIGLDASGLFSLKSMTSEGRGFHRFSGHGW